MSQFRVHEHFFVSGPRSNGGYDKGGKWITGRFSHSHAGGSVPHTHPETGPSCYGGRKQKLTTRPTGEQMEMILRTPEENTFELIITDSALIHGETPIGNTPIEALGFPAAQRMVDSFGLTCVIRDERTGGAA